MDKLIKPELLFLLCIIACTGCSARIAAVEGQIKATGYDQHVELHWPRQPGVTSYEVWVSAEKGELVKRATVNDTMYMDFVNDLGSNLRLQYKVVGLNESGDELDLGITAASTRDFSDEELIDMVEFYT